MLPAWLSPDYFFSLNLKPLVVPALVALLASGCILWQLNVQSQQVSSLQQQNQRQLFEAQLQLLQQQRLQSSQASLEAQLIQATSGATQKQHATIDALYSQYQALQTKISRNSGAKLDISSITNQYPDWGQKLLNQQFDQLASSFTTADASLDTQYQTYQASLPTPTPKSVVVKAADTPADGYTHTSVATSHGTFGVYLIKMKLAEVTVKTLSGNTANCTNSCPTTSLSQYVQQVGGYAGMNGTYFCPPDYASCAGKTNSYDFAFYNSSIGGWLNSSALTWDSEGLATFSGHSAQFYRYARDYDGHSVSAGIANFPPLLVQHGQVVTTTAEQSAYQQQKGTKGALGVDSTFIYLALISSASLTDAAYAMQALGATEVLNLDGGGSSAMYISGGYKVGPGRSLPNAVVLVKN